MGKKTQESQAASSLWRDTADSLRDLQTSAGSSEGWKSLTDFVEDGTFNKKEKPKKKGKK